MSRPLIGAFGRGTAQAVVIRLRDPSAAAAGKLTKFGSSLAFGGLPGTMTNVVYDEARKQIAGEFSRRGIDADVQVVEDKSPYADPRPPSDLFRGIAVGGALVGGGYLLWKHVLRGWLSRRK